VVCWLPWCLCLFVNCLVLGLGVVCFLVGLVCVFVVYGCFCLFDCLIRFIIVLYFICMLMCPLFVVFVCLCLVLLWLICCSRVCVVGALGWLLSFLRVWLCCQLDLIWLLFTLVCFSFVLYWFILVWIRFVFTGLEVFCGSVCVLFLGLLLLFVWVCYILIVLRLHDSICPICLFLFILVVFVVL